MQRIEPGTARWDEIIEAARALHARGALTMRRLRDQTSCGGEVAARVIVAVHGEPMAPADADTAAEGAPATGAADGFEGTTEALWNEAALRLKRIALQAQSDHGAQVATSRDAEVRRLNGVLSELQEERENLVGALREAYDAGAAARAQADAECAARALCAREVDEARGRGARAEEEVVQLRAALERETANRVHAAEALTKVSADLNAAAARAKEAEGEAARLREALLVERTERARLRGELDATRSAMADLRALFDSVRAGTPRRALGRKQPTNQPK